MSGYTSSHLGFRVYGLGVLGLDFRVRVFFQAALSELGMSEWVVVVPCGSCSEYLSPKKAKR